MENWKDKRNENGGRRENSHGKVREVGWCGKVREKIFFHCTREKIDVERRDDK